MGPDAQVESPQALVVHGKLQPQRAHRGVHPGPPSIPVALSRLFPDPCRIPLDKGPCVQIGAIVREQGTLRSTALMLRFTTTTRLIINVGAGYLSLTGCIKYPSAWLGM